MPSSPTITIVNVTLPQLQGALSATPDQVRWVITLDSRGDGGGDADHRWIVAPFRPAPGHDLGRGGISRSRRCLCATATSLAPLLVYRIGQGAFGAPMVPLGQAIVVATYPPEKTRRGAGLVRRRGRARARHRAGAGGLPGRGIQLALGVSACSVPLCAIALLMVLAFIKEHGRQAGGAARLDRLPGASLGRDLPAAGDGPGRAAGLGRIRARSSCSPSPWRRSFYVFLVHTLTL